MCLSTGPLLPCARGPLVALVLASEGSSEDFADDAGAGSCELSSVAAAVGAPLTELEP